MSHAGGREVISLHIGQAGIQMGASIWEQYCKEHGINLDGEMISTKIRKQERIRKNSQGEWEIVKEDEKKSKPRHKVSAVKDAKVFFTHLEASDAFCPRSVMVDLEPNVIDDLKDSAFGGLFYPPTLLSGKEDAANNYARGRYTTGKEISEDILEVIRKHCESSDHVQAFIFNSAVGGGTGSGLGGLLAEELMQSYKKVPRLSFAVYPSLQLSTAVVEPYNALLSTKDLIEFFDICSVLDNEAGYDRVANFLFRFSNPKSKPSYYNINALVCKVVSSVTSGLRFSGQQQFTVADLQTNLIPFPRLHFTTCSMSPIVSTENKEYSPLTEQEITFDLFSPDYMFVKYHDWDALEDQYLGISITYRGNVGVTAVNAAIQQSKAQSKVKLVDWCPTGFKISMLDKPCSVLPGDGLLPTDRTAVMIGNNTAIARPMRQRIATKYDLLYSQRAFVHWYVGEGMEEGEFAEAREDIELLIGDYEESKHEQETDNLGPELDDDDY